MKGTTHGIGIAVGVLLVSSWMSAGADVRVEDNEAVFTLQAPGAQRVFLVGDFNNWNPTLERMDTEGDLFIIRLYLLAGTYRYKFVVDGEWIVDPENPPADPKRGSLLVLEERAGMIVMGSDAPPEEQRESKLEPALRYNGVFFLDDGDTDSEQAIDVYFAYVGKGIRAKVDFQTLGDSWSASPLEAEVLFNRGFAELYLGDAVLRAFESDSVWTSSDPYRVVGDVGIYRYNAGYTRKGFAFESPEILKTRVRALYADYAGARLLSPVTLPASAFDGFPSTTTSDTLVYDFNGSLNDADTWAWEVAADFGSLLLGYGTRLNRGLHPGLMADVTRTSGGFDVTTYNTRERWTADVVWLSWRVLAGLTLTGGWGHSSAHVQQTTRSALADTTLGDVGVGEDSDEFDGEVALQSDTRWSGTLRYQKGKVTAEVEGRWNEFDFDAFVVPASTAEIGTIALNLSYEGKTWNTGGNFRFIDQDYGATPVDFHYFVPARNFWLDWGDGLDVIGQVEFDMPRATDVSLSFGWNDAHYDLNQPLRPIVPLALRLGIEAVTPEVLERLEYAAARIDGEYGLSERLYVDVHGRLAHYDKPSWQVRETYSAYYVETGYRNTRFELSAGFGPDPVVLDPIPNTYRNNGWQETLRQGLPADVTRDQSTALGDGLQAGERFLKDNHVFQLELILFF